MQEASISEELEAGESRGSACDVGGCFPASRDSVDDTCGDSAER